MKRIILALTLISSVTWAAGRITNADLTGSAGITNANLASMTATTIKGNSSGAPATPSDLTGTQVTSLLDNFTSIAKGLAPASGGGTSNFLRADGTWAAPAGTPSPLTTKGDIYSYDTGNTRLPVGTNGQFLRANSATATGLEWQTVSYENPLTFSTGLTRTVDTITVNTSQNISTLSNLTTNGFVKTSGGTGALSVQTSPIPSADINGGRTVNAQTGTTYTFALSDGSMSGGFPLVTLDNAAAITATVPLNASVAFPVGTQIDVVQLGAGDVTITPAGGVTINSESGLVMNQYRAGSLVKTGTDTWQFFSGAGGGGGSGTVTSVSVVSANGFAGSVATATTTPAITLSTTITGLLKGNGTAISAAVSGTDYAPATSGSAILKGNGAGGFSNAVASTDYIASTTGSAIQKADGSGGLAAASGGTDYEFPLTFSTGLTRSTNTITVNTTQNISKLSNLTTNGYVKTGSGDGTLSVQTAPIPSSDIGGSRTINAQTGTTYTFALADGSGAGGYPLVTGSNAAAQTFTVPPESSVSWPAGTQIDVCQMGAGKLTLAQGSGVTINSKSGNKSIGAQYVCVSLIRISSDNWLLTGDLIP